jgi:hypothetical protein
MYGLGSINNEAGFGVTVNALIRLANEKLDPKDRLTVPDMLVNLAKRYANWDDAARRHARNLGRDPFTDIVQDLAESILPSDINKAAIEEWSKKEGWSYNYFVEKVLPRIEDAW